MLRTIAKQFCLVFVTFVVLDALWLGLVAPEFYQAQIGFLLRDTPDWYAAGAFYLLFLTGLTYFVVSPSIRENSLPRAVLTGGLFGLVTYATYDLTNQATIEGWPLVVTIVDLVWGASLCAATSYFSTWLWRKTTASAPQIDRSERSGNTCAS